MDPLPGDPPVPGSFLSNRIGMQFGARIGFAGFLDKADFPLGLAPVPKGGGGRQIRGTTHSAAVLQASKSPDTAFELVSDLTLPETNRLWIGWPGGEPLRKSVADGGAFEKGLQPWEDAGVYREALRGLRGHQLPLRSTEMDALWKDAQKAIWVGERSSRRRPPSDRRAAAVAADGAVSSTSGAALPPGRARGKREAKRRRWRPSGTGCGCGAPSPAP